MFVVKIANYKHVIQILIPTPIKKFRKILIRLFVGFLLLILLLGFTLSLPFVQTKIGSVITEKINNDFGTDITIQKVSVTVFGGVKLKQVLVRDHHKDTLFYITRFKTSISDYKRLYEGDLLFGSAQMDGFLFKLKHYKNESETNLDRFVAAFDDGKPSSGKFLLKADRIDLKNSRFIMLDENKEVVKDVDFLDLNATLLDFKIKGSDVTSLIQNMSFKDFRGLKVNELDADFTYTKKNIILNNLKTKTSNSSLEGAVVLKYKREDFSDFNNKVVFDVQLDNAVISTNDIYYFYKELGRNNSFVLSTHLTGTLNNFTAENLKLVDQFNSEIYGQVNFQNLFSKNDQSFYMEGSFEKVTSNYQDLIRLLPNILGKSLPSSLAKMGQFTITGTTQVSTQSIVADIDMQTSLGGLESNLIISNTQNIDNASYEGMVKLKAFDVGTLINRKDIGLVSLDAKVNGKGFTEQYIDTRIRGALSLLQYNQYNYTGIVVDGNFKKPIFSGKVNVNDPNLFMEFDGVVDVSKNENIYKFTTQIDYANLHALQFMKDSISVFKGKVYSNLIGNSIDNLHGEVLVEQTSYQNVKDIYIFDNFKLVSSFDANRERTITINSPDIVEGKVVGKFDFYDVPDIIENALGSIYTNYKPNKVRKGQYLKFNFSIFNKIVEIFFPSLTLSPNTFVRGNMNSDTNDFKLNFESPEISLNEIKFEKVAAYLDNKNPLFNTYVSVDSLKSKWYKIADFNLINVTQKDSMFIRTEFKGGKKLEDYYNIDAYHTLDENSNSVVGFLKSELNFKDYLWNLNETNNNRNKIIFDKEFKNFNFDALVLTHQNQKVSLNGLLSKNEKDLSLAFDNVNLGKIIPDIDNVMVEGNLDGQINFKQIFTNYEPYASLDVNDLKINSIALGNLSLDITGTDDLKSFEVSSSLRNKDLESFLIDGLVTFDNQNPNLNLDLKLNNFNIGAFGAIGGEVISNIRGLVSGSANFKGNLSNPEMNGRLFFNNAGLTVPYLNVDYQLQPNAIVDLTERQFLIRNIELTDTKYKSKGTLSGNIRHSNLSDWKLDLEVNSNYLAVLDTKDSDDAYYYGKAFISGNASITGPTNALLIAVNAKSEKGTAIKIPISDVQSVGDKSFIHFVTKEEKYNLGSNSSPGSRNYNGLELVFELDINKNAEIEVILDKETNHNMVGRGVGILSLQINTLGKFNMFGDFMVEQGVYNFKYRGLVSKKFDVKKNGNIVWEGDPMRARLNLEAIYETRANPGILLNNTTVNQKVPVEVAIAINGTITNPEPDFNINFPTISSVLKSEIQTKLDDKDTRNTQALYLLASGSFLSPEGGAVGQNALYNNLFETVSGVFDNIFNDEESKINIGVGYVAADRTPGRETDGNVGVTTSFNLNDRISVNGNLGVPIGGINDAAVVGDVEILYRVNKDGTLNMRVFNRENDINYIGEGIGYTQGLGVSYQVDFDTFKELISKVFKNAKVTEEQSNSDEFPDSDFAPEFIKFTERKKVKTSQPKTDPSRAPEE